MAPHARVIQPQPPAHQQQRLHTQQQQTTGGVQRQLSVNTDNGQAQVRNPLKKQRSNVSFVQSIN